MLDYVESHLGAYVPVNIWNYDYTIMDLIVIEYEDIFPKLW